MSNWSLTYPLLRRLERAVQHRIDRGSLHGVAKDRESVMRLIDAALLRADIQALLLDADRRGARDADMSQWLGQLIHWLEPPSCEMGHCEHAGGVGAFCRCALEREPARCEIRRDYRRRVAARTKRAKARVLAVLAARGQPCPAAAVREALGCNPENLQVENLLRELAADGLASAHGARLDPAYQVTESGLVAAAATGGLGEPGSARQDRRCGSGPLAEEIAP